MEFTSKTFEVRINHLNCHKPISVVIKGTERHSTPQPRPVAHKPTTPTAVITTRSQRRWPIPPPSQQTCRGVPAGGEAHLQPAQAPKPDIPAIGQFTCSRCSGLTVRFYNIDSVFKSCVLCGARMKHSRGSRHTFPCFQKAGKAMCTCS